MIISEALIKSFGNFFGKKVKLFRLGQKEIFHKLSTCKLQKQSVIWMHVSSLGEYEQGLPILEKLKLKYPKHLIVLSFFSPSGYEIKKQTSPADCVIYLPVDTPGNAKKLLNLLQPEMVFFVKYDFWPNYLFELKKRNIKTYLVSGLFTTEHKFFKPWNKWLKNSLNAFHHFFVQDKNSKQVLLKQGFKNISVVGDTRFDRVYQIAENREKPEFLNAFKQEQKLIIAGSTWEQDEALLVDFINQNKRPVRFILAPHQIQPEKIEQLKNKIQKNCVCYSETQNFQDADVLILDTIGLLSKTYAFADIAYIGGGFGKGIHNIQEPAVFGTPIVTGPKIHKFKEANDLLALDALKIVHNAAELSQIFNLLLDEDILRKQLNEIIISYIKKNLGATNKIIDIIS